MDIKKVIVLLSALLFAVASFSLNQQERDSLIVVYKTESNSDSVRLRALNKVVWSYGRIDLSKAKKLGQELKAKAQEIGNKFYEGKALNAIAVAHWHAGLYDHALILFDEAITFAKRNNLNNILNALNGNKAALYRTMGDYSNALELSWQTYKAYELLGDIKGMAGRLNTIGITYKEQGNYPNAFKYLHQALKMYEDEGSKPGQANAHNNLGITYVNKNEYKTALEHYFKSMKINEELGRSLGGIINNIAGVYKLAGNLKKSNEYYSKSLDIQKLAGSKRGIANGLHNIGEVFKAYFDAGYDKMITLYPKLTEDNLIKYNSLLLDSCETYLIKAQKLYKENGIVNHLATCNISLGGLNRRKENWLEAIKFFNLANDIAKERNMLVIIRKANHGLYMCYDALGRYKEAHEAYVLSRVARDSMENKKALKAALREQMQYEYDIAERERNETQQRKDEIAAKEKSYQNKLILMFGAGMMIIGLLAFVIFQKLIQSNKQKKLITLQNDRITGQKDRIEEQKLNLEVKNKEVEDSITYAKTIQEAILPSNIKVKELIPDSFIYYLPKDIVAGDFYWIHKAEEGLYVAACDCTGHGVPGAMVSVVCYNALNSAVREHRLTKPSDILDKTKELVLNTFEGAAKEVNDGMDIALLKLGENKLEYAGANSPLYLVDGDKLAVIKPDKQPIGKFLVDKPFTNHVLPCSKGTQLYLFSDGYIDQFGGPKGKKFKSKRFKEVLMANQDLSSNEMKGKLAEEFRFWKGELEQVDDICIIGVKI